MKKRILAIVLALALSLSLMVTAGASGQTVVYAGNEAELLAAVKNSNTKIVLEGKDYHAGFWIENVSNLTIEGTEKTRILYDDGGDVVIGLSKCQNVALVNLTVGHDLPKDRDSCDSGVVYTDESSVTITNCDLFGCGWVGLTAGSSTVVVEDSIIRDCSERIADGWGGCNVTFNRCTFSGNGYKETDETAISFGGSNEKPAQIKFTSCTFTNNKNRTMDSRERHGNSVNYVYENCFFSGNAWGNDTKAVPANSSVLVNGEKKNFDAYSIGGSNYFKLRDLAYVLNGTEKQFEVGWDSAANAITLTSGKAYTPAGGEMAAGSSKNQNVTPATAKILVDGKEVALTAYSIGGNNYFKLRDVGQVFDFGIGWDAASSTITIDTTTGYTAG